MLGGVFKTVLYAHFTQLDTGALQIEQHRIGRTDAQSIHPVTLQRSHQDIARTGNGRKFAFAVIVKTLAGVRIVDINPAQPLFAIAIKHNALHRFFLCDQFPSEEEQRSEYAVEGFQTAVNLCEKRVNVDALTDFNKQPAIWL